MLFQGEVAVPGQRVVVAAKEIFWIDNIRKIYDH
jgi:hypothetical protein